MAYCQELHRANDANTLIAHMRETLSPAGLVLRNVLALTTINPSLGEPRLNVPKGLLLPSPAEIEIFGSKPSEIEPFSVPSKVVEHVDLQTFRTYGARIVLDTLSDIRNSTPHMQVGWTIFNETMGITADEQHAVQDIFQRIATQLTTGPQSEHEAAAVATVPEADEHIGMYL